MGFFDNIAEEKCFQNLSRVQCNEKNSDHNSAQSISEFSGHLSFCPELCSQMTLELFTYSRMQEILIVKAADFKESEVLQ